MAPRLPNGQTWATLKQAYACVATGMGAACMMYAMNFGTFGLPSMKRDPNISVTDTEINILGSVGVIVSIFGNIVAGVLVGKYGHKMAMLIGGGLHCIGSIGLAYCSSALQAVFWRSMFGLSGSLLMLAGMGYMAEIVAPSNRDLINSMTGVMFQAGMLCAFSCGLIAEWRSQALFGAILGLVAIFMVSFLPETPMFAAKKGGKRDGISSLGWYRASDAEAKKELEGFYKNNDKTASTVTFAEVFSAPYLKPMSVILLLFLIQQISLAIPITMKAVELFEDFGTSVDPQYCTLMIAVVSIIMAIVGGKIHAAMDRKTVFLGSSMLVCNILLFLGVYKFALDGTGFWRSIAKNNNFAPLVFVLFYFAGQNIGLGPMPMMYVAEGLPSNARGLIMGLVSTINTIAMVFTITMYDYFIASLGYPAFFIISSLVTFCITCYVYNMMEETKGLKSSDVDNRYEGLRRKEKRKTE